MLLVMLPVTALEVDPANCFSIFFRRKLVSSKKLFAQCFTTVLMDLVRMTNNP